MAKSISIVGTSQRVVEAPGLTIDELAGNVASKNDRISIARVKWAQLLPFAVRTVCCLPFFLAVLRKGPKSPFWPCTTTSGSASSRARSCSNRPAQTMSSPQRDRLFSSERTPGSGRYRKTCLLAVQILMRGASNEIRDSLHGLGFQESQNKTNLPFCWSFATNLLFCVSKLTT